MNDIFMKKNLIIGLLISITILSLLFGFYQLKKVADFETEILKLEQLLNEANVKVEEQTKIIEFQEKISIRLKEQVETMKLNAALNEQKQK